MFEDVENVKLGQMGVAGHKAGVSVAFLSPPTLTTTPRWFSVGDVKYPLLLAESTLLLGKRAI
jgi:hypothetical protein